LKILCLKILDYKRFTIQASITLRPIRPSKQKFPAKELKH
jgi:hypothetical protein